MLHSFVPQRDARGDRHTECPEDCPFAMGLHHRLKELGYLTCPKYIISTIDLLFDTHFRVQILMPRHPNIPEENLFEIEGGGATEKEAISDAACRALARLCTLHSDDLEGSDVMYFPPSDRTQPGWKHKIHRLDRTA